MVPCANMHVACIYLAVCHTQRPTELGRWSGSARKAELGSSQLENLRRSDKAADSEFPLGISGALHLFESAQGFKSHG